MKTILRKLAQSFFYEIKINKLTMNRLQFILVLSSIAAFFFLSGCDDGHNGLSDYQKAYNSCVDAGGIVEQSTDAEGNIIDVCKYQEIATYDDGEQILTIECELQAFYRGECNDSPGADGVYEVPPLVETGPKTVRHMIDDQVEDILMKLDNTGYSHRPFDLHPNYTELASQTESKTIDQYDLFLDCSGFVGYYVLQGIAEPLYKKLPRCYSCGPLEEEEGVTTPPARPLAADFYDHILELAAYSGNEAVSVDNACWSRVPHISDALPGDVIVYLHKGNLDLETKYCCDKDGTEYKTKIVQDESDCTDGRIIYKAKKDDDGNSKNTGHVLFIHDLPYRSTEKKDCTGTYQWVVEVADSTTSPHMFDSRKKGEGNSFYGPNYYHAWTKGDEGYVQRCSDGSYHRDCTQHNTSQAGDNIEINTSGDHATGIGVGKMYINDNMFGYRVNYSHKTEYAEVMIGRPVPCEQ